MVFTRFLYCEGSSPSGKTHVFAWNGTDWVLPCDTLPDPQAATFTKPVCKICERYTSQVHPYPVS